MKSLFSTKTAEQAAPPPAYQALYDFIPQGKPELALKKNEIIYVTRDLGNGWSEATHATTMQTGIVPTAYVTKLEPVQPVRPSPPPAPLSKTQALANEHNECSICCEEMPTLPCSVLLDAKRRRTCRHFLHTKCAQSILEYSTGPHLCPTCRAEFTQIMPVPDLAVEPRRWFQTVDLDGNGQLSKTEVWDLLRTFLLGVDLRKMEQEFDKYWSKWDKDGSGELSFSELCDPRTGMIADFQQNFKAPAAAAAATMGPPTLAMGTMNQWFQYWDEDKSQSLDKEEIVRALIKTFGLSQNLIKVNELRETVENIWGAFDFDGSGEISQQEFTQPGVGLGESLVASLNFHK